MPTAAARAGAVVLAEYSAAAQVVCCSHMQQPCAQQATTARQALVGVDWLYKSLTQKSLIPVSPEWQPYPGPSIPGFREAAPEISASGFQDMERTVMQFRVMCTGTVHNAQVVPDRTSHVVVADPNNLSQKMHMVKARGAEQAGPSGHKEEEEGEEEEDLTEPMDDDEGEEGGQGHAGVPGPSPPAPPPAPSSALGSPLQRGATAPADHSNPPSLQAHQPAPAAPRLASGPAAAPPRTATGPGSGASSPAPPDQVAVVTAVTQAVAARPAPLPPPPPQPGGGWVSGEGGGGAGVGRGAAAGADGDDGADPEDDDVTEEPEETEELDTQDASSWQAGLCPGYCTPPPSTHALLPAPCSAPLAAAAPEGAIDPPAAAGTTPDVGQQQRPGLATARRDGQSHTGPPPRLPLAAVSPAAEGFSSRAAQAGSPGLTAEATGGGPVRVQQPSPPLQQEHKQAAAAAPLALTAASRTPGADPSATGATGSDSALGRQTGGAPELAPLHQHPPTPGLAGAPAAAAALRVPQGPAGTGPAEHPPTPPAAAHGSPGLLPATGPAPHHPVTLTPPPLHQAACSQATGGNAHQALLASGGTGGHVRGRGRADLPPVAPQPPSGSFYAAAGLQGQAVGRPSQGSEAALGFAGDEDSIALLTRASTAVHSVSSGPGRWGSATQDEAGWAAAGQLLQQLVPTGLGMGMGRACSSGSSEDAGDQQPAWLAGRPTAQAKAQQCKVAPASVGLAEEAAKQAVQQSGRRNQEQQDQALPQLGPDGCTGDSHSGAVEPAPLDPSSGLHAAAEEALKSGFLVMRPIKRREGRVGSVQAPELKRQAASSTSASEVCCNDVAQPANTAKDAVQKMADSPLPARKRGKQAKVKPSASAAAAKSCNKELQAAAPAAAAELNDVAMPGSILSPTAGTTVDTLPTKPAAPPKKAAIQSSPTAEEAECRASRPSRRRGASGAAQGRCEDPAAPAAEVPAVSSPQGSGDQQRAAEDNLGINMEEDASAATAATVQQAAAKPAVGRGRGRLKMEPAPLLADAQQGASNKAGKRKRPSTGAVAAGAAADEEISATEGAAAAAAGPLHSATAAGAGVNTVASTPTAPPAPQPAGGKTSGRKSARDAKPAPVPAAAPQPAAPTSADPGPAKRRKQQHPEAGSEAGDLPHTAQPQAPIQPAPKLQSPEPGAAGLAAEGGGPCKAKGSGKAAKQKPSSSSTAQRAPIGPPSGLDTEMAEAQPAASSPHKPHPAAQVPAAADTAKPRNSRRQPLPAAQPAAATPITAALSPVGSALPGGAGRSSGKAGAAAAAAAKAAAAVQDATPTAAPTTLPAAPVQVAVAGSAGAAGEETRQPRSSRAQRAQEPAAQPAAPARSSRQSRQAAEGAAAGKGVDAPELCMAGKQADTADAAPGSAASSRPQGRAASRRRQASSGASALLLQPPAAVLSEGEQSEGEAEGEEAEEAEAEEVVPSAPRTSSRKGAGSVGGVRAGSAVKGKTAALASAAAAKGQHASTPGARATCLDGPAPVQRASRGRDNGKAAGAGKVTPGGAGSGAVAGEPGEAVQGPGSMVVAFSGMSSEERKQAAGALKRIRIRCLQGPSWEPCVTAILLPAMKRTDKVICGLAAGNWLLDSTRYLKACTSASSWVPPAAYEHQGGHEPQGQGEPGGRLEPGAAPHWRQHRVSTGSGAFAGLRVVLLGSLPPPLDRAAVQLMLQAGGGEVMAVAGTAAALPSLTPLLTGDSKPHLAVVDPAKQQPDRLVAAALEAGVTCVAPAYLVEWVAQPSCCPLPPATYLHGSRPGPELQRLEEDRGLELSAADAQGYMSESL
ncbi:hypothetical protein QJQ45_027407 [Haematococcus lacustris]|nr:hypothetical protein QJQ45_027407 [Haematococcus lacustris]